MTLWKPVQWARTTIDEDEIERQRQKALWKRLEHLSDPDDEERDEVEEDEDES